MVSSRIATVKECGELVVRQFEIRFLYGPRFPAISSGSKSTISSIFHLRSAIPALTAGVVFRV
jgi:hypothetical protein